MGYLLPLCPICRRPIQKGDLIAEIAAEIMVGGIRTAYCHMSCALMEVEKGVPEKLPRQDGWPPRE